MSDEISIGLLLPTSNVLPMAKDFEKGFKAGLKESGVDMDEIELVKEFIGQGDERKVDGVLENLIGIHNVDAVAGIVSNLVAGGVGSRMEKRTTPFFVHNVGGHFIQKENFGAYTFFNSIHLWQQCWLLGKWAAEKFGSKGFCASSMFDAGYSFHALFDLGFQEVHGDAIMDIVTCPMPAQGGLSDQTRIFESIEELKPDFIFALFCGEEAEQFLDEFVRRGYAGKIPLLGLPYLLESGKENLNGLQIYTTHHRFEGDQTDVGYRGIFRQLGRDSGELIGKTILKSEEINLETVTSQASETIKNVTDADFGKLKSPVSIVLNEFDDQNKYASSAVISETISIDENERVQRLNEIQLTGWMNPYLCV